VGIVGMRIPSEDVQTFLHGEVFEIAQPGVDFA